MKKLISLILTIAMVMTSAGFASFAETAEEPDNEAAVSVMEAENEIVTGFVKENGVWHYYDKNGKLKKDVYKGIIKSKA